jgi:hypothetical protein
MFTMIFTDGFQFNADMDGTLRVLNQSQILKKYVRGPLSIIECRDSYHDSFMVACTSSLVMAELLQAWAGQF